MTAHLSGPAMSAIFQSFMEKQQDYPDLEPTLSPREIEIMEQFLDPTTVNAQVARKLSITAGTLEIHLNRIYSKLGVEGIRQAIWRFVQIYRHYFSDFFLFYMPQVRELVAVAA